MYAKSMYEQDSDHYGICNTGIKPKGSWSCYKFLVLPKDDKDMKQKL